MPTYALLGATGKTGNAILTHLLKDNKAQNDSITIKTYVRSKSKLLSQFPHLESNPSVQIHEGTLTDIPLLANCISSTDVIFCVLGENENTPGLRIAQDGAHAIIAALCHLGCTNGADQIPRLITLSSSSVNDEMQAHKPAFVRYLIGTAFSNAYMDLRLAERYLRLHEGWLKTTYIQPGALSEEEVEHGHTLSLDRIGAPDFVTYLDLAAGMIEVAEKGGYENKGISVDSKTNDVKFEWKAPKQVARGFVWHYTPVVGQIAKRVGFF